MSADPSSDPSLLDRGLVQELLDILGAAQMRPVLAKFIADTGNRLIAIEHAAAARHMTEIGDHLHTLKSTSATLGFARLARLAHELEAEASRTTVEPARLAALRTALDASVASLAAAFPELA
jgi:HPt (histidine-containing phosphotransfer) domain-containing protein